jgi:hypothetical protein
MPWEPFCKCEKNERAGKKKTSGIGGSSSSSAIQFSTSFHFDLSHFFLLAE